MMERSVTLTATEAEELATKACLALGVSVEMARSLTTATLSAATRGPATLGFPHFLDYLNGFRDGRINLNASPEIERIFPAYLVCDADAGIAQFGFDLAMADLVEATKTFGIAIVTLSNSFTTGELGYYVRCLADQGLIGLAATNANAMMIAEAGGPKLYSTNPLAFGFPMGQGFPSLIIDQAASATAYVNILRAAAEGRSIPEGWAVDETGAHTEDPMEALRGALLPFGGRKGANIALLVEMLAAGLSGGSWSIDAPDFQSGSLSPAVGLTLIAIRPGQSNDDTLERARAHVLRLQALGAYIPGLTGREPSKPEAQTVEIPSDTYDAILRYAMGRDRA